MDHQTDRRRFDDDRDQPEDERATSENATGSRGDSRRFDDDPAFINDPWHPGYVPPAQNQLPPLTEVARRPWMTWLLVVVNLGVYGFILASEQNLKFDATPWVRSYGWYGPRGEDELWRLITYQFLNPWPMAMIMNFVALFALGVSAEKRCGPFTLLAFYLLSGAAAAVTAYWVEPSVLVTGAGWSIVGVISAAAGYVLGCRSLISREERNGMILSFVIVTAATAMMGDKAATRIYPLISAAGVGLLMGIILGWNPFGSGIARGYRLIATSIVVSMGIGLAFHFAPAPAVDYFGVLDNVAAVEKRCLDRYNQLIPRFNDNPLAADTAAEAMRKEILPEWKSAIDSLREIEPLPLPNRAIIGKLIRYMQTRLEGWEMLVDGVKARDLQKQRLGVEKVRQAEFIMK